MSDSTEKTAAPVTTEGEAPVQVLQPVPDEKNLLAPKGDSSAGCCGGSSCGV